jgi:hypothetical protein
VLCPSVSKGPFFGSSRVLAFQPSHEATLFTDDIAKLGPQLGADVSKTSALEITQPSSVVQGMRIEL